MGLTDSIAKSPAATNRTTKMISFCMTLWPVSEPGSETNLDPLCSGRSLSPETSASSPPLRFRGRAYPSMFGHRLVRGARRNLRRPFQHNAQLIAVNHFPPGIVLEYIGERFRWGE